MNHGQGLVIVTTEKYLKGAFEEGLKISDEPSDLGTFEIEQMPEKGGFGVVATRKLEKGDYVIQQCPVALFSNVESIWTTPLGRSIRRQAIDHLPLQTRAAVANLAGGKGQTEDEFIGNIVADNAFTNHLKVEGGAGFAGIYPKASRLNHACKPNVHYAVDPVTQILHMKAQQKIAIGEELTITYCFEDWDRESRQETLQSWGIDCTCSHCLMCTKMREVSEKNVRQIMELNNFFEREDSKWSASAVQEFVNLSETEGIPRYILKANLNAALFYNSQNEMEKVKKHAEEAQFYANLVVAKLCLDVAGTINRRLIEGEEMLLNEPEKHSSHISFNCVGEKIVKESK
ncbi:hypothetical protein PTTG_25277 [Puccinia triticina 1-1 BBBD Race 1]|uniref:SET domain-containing protein n=1 Tax=Puccinia triticina (isolate 1-1 / race 1 (BBBD)) TaxID=630390 RepID=A0A180H4M1_PUCT1|nr:hypothetical protein PTTG_25277 [Puccinia triticina 1-1 BBBD Race 1]